MILTLYQGIVPDSAGLDGVLQTALENGADVLITSNKRCPTNPKVQTCIEVQVVAMGVLRRCGGRRGWRASCRRRSKTAPMCSTPRVHITARISFDDLYKKSTPTADCWIHRGTTAPMHSLPLRHQRSRDTRGCPVGEAGLG